MVLLDNELWRGNTLQFALFYMLATFFSKRQKKNYNCGQNTGITETVTYLCSQGRATGYRINVPCFFLIQQLNNI